MKGEMSSAPMTSALRTTPVRINADAVDSAYKKLVQAVFTSMAANGQNGRILMFTNIPLFFSGPAEVSTFHYDSPMTLSNF